MEMAQDSTDTSLLPLARLEGEPDVTARPSSTLRSRCQYATLPPVMFDFKPEYIFKDEPALEPEVEESDICTFQVKHRKGEMWKSCMKCRAAISGSCS